MNTKQISYDDERVSHHMKCDDVILTGNTKMSPVVNCHIFLKIRLALHVESGINIQLSTMQALYRCVSSI